MKLSVTKGDGYVIAQLDGKIDETAKDDFDKYLHPIVAMENSRMLVDLSGCKFMSSEGLGLLLRLSSKATSGTSRVVFATPSPFVRSMFKVTKLTKVLVLVDTVEEGIERLCASE